MKKICVFVAALLFVAGATAWADDYNVPPWWDETNPAMTYQGWEFNDPCTNPDPDIGVNVHGFQPAIITPDPANPEWIPDFDGRIGIWALSGTIDVPINNYPEPNPEKIVWVQLTWQPQPNFPGAQPTVAGVPIPGFQTTDAVEIDNQPADPSGTTSWIYSTYTYSIFPNPEFEIVTIGGDIYLDEVVIDTWCVPEPLTLALMALGGIGVIRRRKA